MRYLVLLVMIVFISSCVKNKNGVGLQNSLPSNLTTFTVSEVIQGNNYTYLRVTENLTERWVAVSKQDIKTGDVFYYDGAMQMNNFASKELGRTFDVIYFISHISKTPIIPKTSGGSMPAHSGKVETKKLSSINLEKAPGEITVSEVFKNRVEFAAKDFEIRGIVVKINKEVMGRNWIHIQDGTDAGGEFDLTITSQNLPEMGDEVTFRGKISINKDFGSGYRYGVIMEDAVMLNRKSMNNSK